MSMSLTALFSAALGDNAFVFLKKEKGDVVVEVEVEAACWSEGLEDEQGFGCGNKRKLQRQLAAFSDSLLLWFTASANSIP